MITKYERRRFRTRNKIKLVNQKMRPRVVVCRSNKNMHVQLIDSNGLVLASLSTLSIVGLDGMSGLEKSKFLGKGFAKLCLEAKVEDVVFDKGGYSYGGRVKALADSCREVGLKF